MKSSPEDSPIGAGSSARGLSLNGSSGSREAPAFKPDVVHVKLFDENRYITGQGIKNAKWRIIFNGLGNLNYCPTVEKTEKIKAALENNVLDRVRDYLSEIGKANADRALHGPI